MERKNPPFTEPVFIPEIVVDEVASCVFVDGHMEIVLARRRSAIGLEPAARVIVARIVLTGTALAGHLDRHFMPCEHVHWEAGRA